MATVEGAGIPCQELSHGGGEGRAVRATALGRRRAQQEVQVVGEQRPREDDEPGPVDDLRQAGEELGAIPVITKEQAPLDTPHHLEFGHEIRRHLSGIDGVGVSALRAESVLWLAQEGENALPFVRRWALHPKELQDGRRHVLGLDFCPDFA